MPFFIYLFTKKLLFSLCSFPAKTAKGGLSHFRPLIIVIIVIHVISLFFPYSIYEKRTSWFALKYKENAQGTTSGHIKVHQEQTGDCLLAGSNL